MAVSRWVWVCISLTVAAAIPSAVFAEEVDLAEAANKVVAKTNQFRKEHKLPAIEVESTLQKTAQGFADYMARTEKYGHQADGQTPAERATAAGYDYCVVRENIAYRTDSRELTAASLAEHFTQGWIESPGHRENMLAEFATETAVAIASEDGTTFYAVQLFGRPKALSYKVTVANRSDSPWTVRMESEGGKDEIEIPPSGELRMERCFPVTLSIVDTEASLKVKESTEVEIHATSDGPGFEPVAAQRD